MRYYLDTVLPTRRIGKSGPMAWPADCNPLDFFLWEHAKALLYGAEPVPSIEVVAELIMDAFQTVKNTPGILECVQ